MTLVGSRRKPPFSTHFNLNSQPTLIPVSRRGVNIGPKFAIGRVQFVAAAGEAQARPSVRWDGLPGRRSHTSMTPWALGFIPTVRIGAGAWRNQANTRESGDTDQATTHIHIAEGTRKGRRQEKTLLIINPWDRAWNRKRGLRHHQGLTAGAERHHPHPETKTKRLTHFLRPS